MTTTENHETAVMPAELVQLTTLLNNAFVVFALDVGHQAGLFEVMAAAGSVTSDQLAAASGLSERPVREWLALVTVRGVVEYDADRATYSLPSGMAPFVTGEGMNLAAFAGDVAVNAHYVPLVVRSLHDGRGIEYHEQPEFTSRMAAVNRRLYDNSLLDGYIRVVPGLVERLSAGLRACDLGCGSGHVVNLLGRAFPASSFVGFDFSDEAIAAARGEAEAWELPNVEFDARDVAALPGDASFDVVFAFDAIHDLARPRQVLAEARRVLADDGVFMMVDPATSSKLEDNLFHPMGPYIYGFSLFHCMQVSLAQGGEGLGTAYGQQKARELLTEAGFADVDVLAPASMDAFNGIYVARGRR